MRREPKPCNIPQGVAGHNKHCVHNYGKRQPRTELADLRAENAKLRAALMAVTPGCRAPGTCWCEWSRNLKQFGHSYACEEARAALRGDK